MLVLLTPSYYYNIHDEIEHIKKSYNTYTIDYNGCNIELCNKLLELLKLKYKGNLNNNIISINNIIYDTLKLDSNYIYKILSDEFKKFICSDNYNKNKANVIIISGINDVFMFQEIYKNIYKKLSSLLYQYNFPCKSNFIVSKILFKNFNSIVPLNVSFKDSDFDNIYRYNNGKQDYKLEDINKHIDILLSSLCDIKANISTTNDEIINDVQQTEEINDKDIVDEVKCEDINVDNACRPYDEQTYNTSTYVDQETIEKLIQTQFDNLMNKFNDCNNINKSIKASPTVSSYALGKIGEKEVIDMINKIRPEFETVQTGVTGHMADIHAIDHNNNIKYILEIKLKQNLTQNDITKFNKDVDKAIKDNPGFNIIGIFISLNSDKIITIGEFSIDKNKIYLSNKYFSEQILDLIFTMTNVYNNIDKNINQDNKKVDYVIPNSVYRLIANLRKEYNEIEQEREIYNKMKENNSENIKQIEILINKLFIKQQFIKFIDDEFKDIHKSINDNNKTNEEIAIVKYIQQTKQKNISKTYLLNNFPALKTELAAMSLSQIINKYKNYKVIDNDNCYSSEVNELLDSIHDASNTYDDIINDSHLMISTTAQQQPINTTSNTQQLMTNPVNTSNVQKQIMNKSVNTTNACNNIINDTCMMNSANQSMSKPIYDYGMLNEVNDAVMMTETKKANVIKETRVQDTFKMYNVIYGLNPSIVVKGYKVKSDFKNGNYKYCVDMGDWLNSYNNYLYNSKCKVKIIKKTFLAYLNTNQYIEQWDNHYNTKGERCNRIYMLTDKITNNKWFKDMINKKK